MFKVICLTPRWWSTTKWPCCCIHNQFAIIGNNCKSLAHHRLKKKPADTNLMKTGYLKQCIVVSKQIDTHGNGDSKWNTTEF